MCGCASSGRRGVGWLGGFSVAIVAIVAIVAEEAIEFVHGLGVFVLRLEKGEGVVKREGG